MSRKHARLGPSAATRWLTCPGSVREIEKLPPQPPSIHSLRGTHAHAWLEHALKTQTPLDRSHVGMTMDGLADQPPLDQSDIDAINVSYRHVTGLMAADANAELYVEVRLDLTAIDPDIFGTADAVVYVPSEKHLHVCDHKHGVGVTVDVEANPQLMTYALGAYLHFETRVSIEHVTLHVMQPRAHGAHIKSHEVDVLDLFCFSHTLSVAAQRTRDPNAPCIPGDHCRTTFCAAAATCPALQARVSAIAAEGFDVAGLESSALTPEQLGARLRDVRALRAYIDAIEELATREAHAGRPPRGFKLVQGAGRRQWTSGKSEDEIAAAITRVSNAVDPWQRSLITAAQAEKALGKKLFETLSPFVSKKYGSPQLVPESDRRPAYTGGEGFEPIES